LKECTETIRLRARVCVCVWWSDDKQRLL